MDPKIDELIRQMTLEEKASLLSGADNWHTRAIERLGIPAIRMTDGPHGVRRPQEEDRSNWPATSYPTASAQAATWNPSLARRMGEALADETKTKGCDILLGPAVNIHRAPLCGRNFEYYSEDPYLAGRMATDYIKGLQSRNVGASIKHYAANNAEFERFTMSSEVDERALREIYLPAFEMAVKESAPWTVMCSYNKINGTWASENHYLLTDILKDEWGFEGFVVSDWGAVHNRIQAANAGLDLEMPGMGSLPVDIVLNAVRSGQISQETLDGIVRRILCIVFQARSDGEERRFEPEAGNTPQHRALAREIGDEAIVLLKNEGDVLPIRPGKARTIAVFGPNAAIARIEGGGSADVTPYYSVSPLEAIRARAGSSFKVEFAQGAYNFVTLPALDAANVLLPGNESEHSFEATFYPSSDFSGQPLITETVQQVAIDGRDLAEQVRSAKEVSIRWHGIFVAPLSGDYRFGLSAGGKCRLLLDGKIVVDHWTPADIEAFYSNWPFQSKYGEVSLRAGQHYDLVVEYQGRSRLSAGCLPPLADSAQQVADMAASADIAVVVVGDTWEHETEGRDREDWNLPGDQVELIRRVTAANRRTVVVVNTGAPVEMASWIKSTAAVVWSGFTGQEIGNCIADVLFGDATPSGKLPDTWPRFFADNPAFLNFPGENGRVLYGEGIYVGYRYYDAKDIEPLFPFGYGLSYTTFAYDHLELGGVEWDGKGTLQVSVDVTNTGKIAGKETVQLYVRDPQSSLMRPPKELKGFVKLDLLPGETKTAAFTLTRRDLSYYDPALKGWVAEPGEFELMLGASSRDIRASATVELQGGEVPPQPKFGAGSRLSSLMEDPQARAVLQKHLPELANRPEAREAGWVTLGWISLAYMDLVTPEKYQAILSDLANIE